MAELTYLLDTNAISEPLRPSPSKRLLAKLQQYQARIAISSITWHELVYGLAKMRDGSKRRSLELYLLQGVATEIPMLSYDQMAAQWHATERARLAQAGIVTPFVDGQIAAIAVVNHLILVTKNIKDFRPYAGLVLENWLE